MNPRISHLFSLLDEENAQSANLIMAEILRHENNIGPLLNELQESNNATIRRRVHQLQAIQQIRQRRKKFAHSMNSETLSLWDGLIALHLQWYDNDNEETIQQKWQLLLSQVKENHLETISQLIFFLRQTGFSTTHNELLNPDHLCLGLVLTEQVGSSLILSAIASQLAQELGHSLEIISLHNAQEWGLIEHKTKTIILPEQEWQIFSQDQFKHHFRIPTNNQIIKWITGIFFAIAIENNCFNYIQSLGSCMAHAAHQKTLDFLPFPYASNIPLDPPSPSSTEHLS